MTIALATTADVAANLGRPLTDVDEERALALLLLASYDVESLTGFRFAPGTYTISRMVTARKLTVPAHVDSIDEVREVNQYDGVAHILSLGTDYKVRNRDIYIFVSASVVEIDFTVIEPIPLDVIGVVAGIVAATIAGPPVGASSESAGPYQISYVNSTGKVWLSASDKRILKRYMQVKNALGIL